MRWKYRILITLAALIALVIVIVQIVLWSSIPQNLVTNIIQDELGLRITTARLTTGWLGRTTLSNVSLALPLSEQSFLSVKTLKVKHTSLFGLLFGKSLAVQSIELDQPTITVRQDTTGQWNLAEVAQLLARAGGSQTAQDSQLAGIPKLPSVRLIDGFINVSDNQSHTASLPLSIDGAPQGRLIWKYNVVIGNSIKLLGELAPGLNWQHQITLQASNLDPLLKNWGLQSYDTDVVGRWSGRVDGGKIVGRLTLDHYTAKSVPGAGNIALAGAVEIQGNPDSITFLPRKVTLKTTNFALPNIGLTAGAVTADKNGIQANDLQLAVLGGLAVLNGKFDPSTKSTDLSARWSNLALPNHITHSGTLTASLRTPFEGHPSIKIDLTSKGRTITGGWDTEVSIGGLGQSWQSIDWDITAPTLRLNGNHPFEISQLVGHVRQRGPQIELTDLTLPERPHLVSRAAINLRDHNWYLWLDAGGSEKAADTMIPISFTVNAWGNGDRYVLQDFNLTVAEATVWAGGVYDRQIPNPVNLDVYLTQSPQLSSDTPIQGHFSGSFHISGLLFQEPDMRVHPRLNMTGSLKSSDLVLLDRPIGDINAQLTGVLDDGDVDLTTTQMSLLQGNWVIAAHRHYDEPTEIQIQVRSLPIEELARFAKIEEVGGLLDADWDITVPKSLNPNQVKVDSHYNATRLNFGTFLVDEISAHVSLQDGYLKLNSLRAKSGDGSATATASFNLNDREHLEVESKVDRWTFGTQGGALLQLSVSTKLDLNLRERGASGPLLASADLLLNKAQIAHAELATTMRGRVLNASKITGNILNGQLIGTASIDLDRPLQAEGNIHWSEIDASKMTAISPAFNGLGGRYSGAITFAPAVDPRPLEPVRIDINISAEDGHYKSVSIGEGLLAVHAVAYANIDRIVLDHSDIHFAGGIMHLWARASQKLAAMAAQVDFENLQLDQFTQLEKTDPGPTPGLVTGRFTLLSSGNGLDGLVGNGKIQLTQTDLGRFGPISALYSALHLSFGKPAPTGVGSAALALEANILRVNNFHFYNRGVDAFGVIQVGPNILDPGNARLGGQIAGTLRPLKNSRLTLLADFDDAFSSVQEALTPITLSGTVSHPRYRQTDLDQAGQSLREILGGNP